MAAASLPRSICRSVMPTDRRAPSRWWRSGRPWPADRVTALTERWPRRADSVRNVCGRSSQRQGWRTAEPRPRAVESQSQSVLRQDLLAPLDSKPRLGRYVDPSARLLERLIDQFVLHRVVIGLQLLEQAAGRDRGQ